TAILKQPVSGPVRVGLLGLDGDEVGSKKHHGGPDQALYLYGTDDYAWWAQELGHDLVPGTFGENLTVEGLRSAEVRVGDRFEVGSAVLEATGPRIPCETLAGRMEDRLFVKRFAQARRPGVYVRVLQEGSLQAGDEVTLVSRSGDTIGLLTLTDLYYDR